MKKLFVFFSFLLLWSALNAQQKEISGTILTPRNTPVYEVLIKVKGTSVETYSDEQGRFTINVPTGHETLTFEKPGMEVTEIDVANVLEVNVVMNPAGTEDLFNLSMAELMEIEVETATNRKENLSEAPATMAVLTIEDLENQGYTELSEMFNELPGMDITRAYGNFYVRNYWRGFRTTLGSPYLFMVDGMVFNSLYYNDPEGAMISMPLSNIEQVEVVYGPASSIYGANAAMGVINVRTKNNAETNGIHTTGRLTSGFGDNQWLSKIADINLFYKQDKFRMSFTGRFDITDQNMKYRNAYEWTKDTYYNDTLLWGDFLNNQNMGGNLTNPRRTHSIDLRAMYEGTQMGFQLYDNTVSYGMTYPADKYLSQSEWKRPEANIFLKHNEKLGDIGNSVTLVRYRTSHVPPSSMDVTRSADTLLSVEHWHLHNSSFIAKEDITLDFTQSFTAGLGFKYAYEDMSQSYDYVAGPLVHPDSSALINNYNYPPIPAFVPKNTNRIISEESGAYANLTFKLHEISAMPSVITNNRSNLILGSRFDYNSIFGWSNTYRVGYVGNFDQFTIKLLYGEAFQEPPPSILYASFEGRVASSDLAPEESNTIEANATYTQEKYTVTASVYKVNVDNTLVDIEGKTQNAGTRDIFGADLFLQFLPLATETHKLRTWAFYSFIQGEEEKFDNNGNAYTENIGDLSNHKIKMGATYNFQQNFQATLLARYIGERETVASNPVDKVDANFVMDANVSYDNLFDTNFGLSFRVTNLFDTEYFHPGVSSANAGTTPGYFDNAGSWIGSAGWYNSLLPQPGRTYYVSLNLNF